MKRLALIASAFAIAACDGAASSSVSNGDPYLSDASFRRAALVSSLVNDANGYATERLARYDSGDANDWSRLPESNPKVAVIGTSGAPIEDARALSLDDPNLAEEAFFRYPVEEIGDPDLLASGFWTDASRGLGGLVRVTYANGLSATAMTCSTCHAREDASGLTIGAPNGKLDRGWGPGLLDVTTTTRTEPVAISDLRPVRFLGYLHHDANVKQTDETALAIRIETLIITSHAEVSRPPREVARALATFVRSLADALPAPPPLSHPGAAVFASTCGGCHSQQNDTFTGAPVPIAVVGTDPTLGLSSERGTGNYRVPSLRGVSTRGALLHDLSVPSVANLLDSARTTGGHMFGHELDDTSRAALLDYVQAL